MANATKAGIVIEYGDEEYTLSPLGLRELEFLENWAQGRTIAAGRESLPEGISVKDADVMMGPIIAHAMRINIMEGGFAMLRSPAGVVRLMYISMKRKSPDITLDKVREMFMDDGAKRDMMDAVNQLNPNPKRDPSKNPQEGAEGSSPPSSPEKPEAESAQSSQTGSESSQEK